MAASSVEAEEKSVTLNMVAVCVNESGLGNSLLTT
jgi:hypothetical protein